MRTKDGTYMKGNMKDPRGGSAGASGVEPKMGGTRGKLARERCVSGSGTTPYSERTLRRGYTRP